jgi:phage recombination protein Bet
LLKERADQLGLDPVSGEIHLIKRNKEEKPNVWVETYTFQIGIEGFRKIADRSGNYDGQEAIVFTVLRDGQVLETPVVLEDDKLVAATAKVYRKGINRPFTHTAHLRDYVQKTRQGKTTAMWVKETIMLPKCAEAGAFRKGFPDLALGEVYEPAELPSNEDGNGHGNGNGSGCAAADIMNGKTISAPPWSGFDPVPAASEPAATEVAAESKASGTTVEPATAAPAATEVAAEITAPAASPSAPDAAAPKAAVKPAATVKQISKTQTDAILRLSKAKECAPFEPEALEGMSFEEAAQLIKKLNGMKAKEKEVAA